MKENAIISLADSNYYELLNELIDSIKQFNHSEKVAICILDAGLTEGQTALLKNKVDEIKKAEWDIEVPQSKVKGKEWLKSQVSRAFLPKYFPNYKKYLWIDCDAWVQDWSAIELYFKACNNGKLGITQTMTPGYRIFTTVKWLFGKLAIIKSQNFKHAIKSKIDINKARKLAFAPHINIGVFSLEKDSNCWNVWQKNLKQTIKAGDIFQVVPSQRFETNFKSKGSSLYKVLRLTNPSPFMYYFNLPNFQIVGSSPEILVRLRSDLITLRPIAGTRPRGKNIKQDRKYELDLLSDEKETSEHLMLLDLGRNDVGKVAKKSTVSVTAKFIIEKYSHVMHLVSNVTGKLKKNISTIEALMAGFPAGTVSGAPKIRAMQIIDELETDVRGIYAGGIGYISPDGDMDTCIVLRTGIITKNKLYVQAGGGVVYDSDPELEYMETVNKAKAVLNAAEIVLGNNL